MQCITIVCVSVAENGKYLWEEPTEKKSTWASWVATACCKEVCQTVTLQYILMTPASRRISAEAFPFSHSFVLSTIVCLSHFSVTCLVTRASPGRGGVIFRCCLEDVEVANAFSPLLSGEITRSKCLRENWRRILRSFGELDRDTRMDNGQINISLNSQSNVAKVNTNF